MITTQDKELLAKKGITEAQIAEQLACFQTGFPYLKLDAAASIEKGILAPDAEEKNAYLAAWDAYKNTDKNHCEIRSCFGRCESYVQESVRVSVRRI